MQALSHSIAEGATIIYGNMSHKKVPIGGLKDLTSAPARGDHHTYNFGYFRDRRKTALDKLSQMKYTSINNRRKFYVGTASHFRRPTINERAFCF